MKKGKTFKRALSLVLSFIILTTMFATLSCTVSADEIEKVIENNSKQVVLYDFTDATAYRGQYLAYIASNCNDTVINVNFKYYLKASRVGDFADEIYVRNWAISQDAATGNLPNASDGSTYLRNGMGSYSITYTSTKDAFKMGVSLQQHGGVTNAKLYVWDFSITLNGTAVDTYLLNTPATSTDVSICSKKAVSYQEMLNNKRAWHINFNSVANQKFLSASNLFVPNKKVEVSFNYYLKGECNNNTYIYVSKVGAGALGDYKTDDTIVTNKLLEGTHSFKTVFDPLTDNATYAIAFQVGGSNLNADLYIYDFEIYVNGVRQVTKADPLHGYGTVPEGITITETTYYDVMNQREALLLDYSGLAQCKGAYIYNGTLSSDCTFSLSFNYKILNTTSKTEIYVQNAVAGGSYGDRLISDGREHYYSYQGEASTGSFAINLATVIEGSNADIYMWDIRLVTSESQVNTIHSVSVSSDTLYAITYDHIAYSDVVDVDKAYLYDFSTATPAINNSGNWTRWTYKISTNPYYSETKLQTDNPSVTIYFDYYLANANDGDLAVRNVAGGSMPDDTTGSNLLLAGRHSFSITGKTISYFGTGTAGNLLVAIVPNKEGIIDAKLYIWNVYMTCGDTDISKPMGGLYNTSFVGPDVTETTVGDIENKGDANNDGKINVFDLIRFKRNLINGTSIDVVNTNIDKNTKIDAFDLAAIKRVILQGKLPSSNTLKVLCIGNSFSNNTSQYTSQIAAAMGKKLEISSLFYGGCSPQKHLDFYNSDEAAYTLYTNGKQVTPSGTLVTSKEVLSAKQYDIISFQGVYVGMDVKSSFDPLKELSQKVRTHQPNAEFVLNMTWANCQEYLTKYNKGVYSNDVLGELYFSRSVANYEYIAAELGGIDMVPVGLAIQNAKRSGDFTDDYSKETSLFNDDVSHLSNVGKYLASAVWVQYLFDDIDIRNLNYTITNVSEAQATLLEQLAYNAVKG